MERIQIAKRTIALFFTDKLKIYNLQVRIRKHLIKHLCELSSDLKPQLTTYVDIWQQLGSKFSQSKKALGKELTQYNSTLLRGNLSLMLGQITQANFQEVL